MKDIQYYSVGFMWRDTEPSNQLPRFMNEGIWENGYEDKFNDRVNNVPVGSRLAAKTTYTRKEDGKSISILEIHATGTVIDNPQDGITLKVRWDKEFEPVILKNRGAYRSTITRINQLDVIRAIFKVDEDVLRKGRVSLYSDNGYDFDNAEYPCFVFNKAKWDDFGYTTMFDLDFYEHSKRKISIGQVKIFEKNQNDTKLPDLFTTLDESFCSLGQSNEYYKVLSDSVEREISNFLLDAINDVTYNRGLLGDFEHEDVFKTSLLRSSEAQKALREGHRVFTGIDIDNTLRFTFSALMENATRPHRIEFNFLQTPDLPYRTKVLIGKNGTGKTQYIAKLAATLSGYEKQGDFSTEYLPPFSKVIAISYSLFDRFPRPQQTKTFSYHYSGFQGPRGLLTENQVQAKIKRAFVQLEKSDRMQLFGTYLAEVLSDELVAEILDEDYITANSKEFSLFDESGYSRFSSGQVIMILILSEILANIRDESLLIFDEPETHLHPNSISLFIKVIDRILRKFDSYAIISTHSPQIVQETPAKDIIVVERTGNTPGVRAIDLETFGENLNAITERIFNTISHDEYYRWFLKALSERKTYEEIVSIFEANSLPLSLGARIFIQSLYR